MKSWPIWFVVIPLQLVVIGGGVFGHAYLEELGKSLATKEDFEKVLEKQKRTTEELETVRAEVSTGAWKAQKWWDYKRDVYWGLLEALAGMKGANDKLWAHWRRQLSEGMTPEEIFKQKSSPRQSEAAEEYTAQSRRVRALTSVGQIILSDQALSALNNLESQRSESYIAHLLMKQSEDERAYHAWALDERKEVSLAIDRCIDLVAASAQRDLMPVESPPESDQHFP